MRSLRRTLFAIGFLVTAALFAASIASAGHYYESITTDQMQGKKQANQTKVKAWVDGDNSRVEFSSGEKKGWFSDGNYLVTTDGGETVYLIDPKEETYGEFNMEEMLAAMGQAMNMMEQMGGMMKMEFSDVSSEKLLEESGESILGHSTTHYRFKSRYTMTMKIMGMTQQNTTVMLQDIWSTDEFDARGFGVWLRPDRRMQTGNEELDKLLNQELGKMKGFPLKMVNEMTMTNKKGKTRQNTSSTEVDVLREESIAGDRFEWPSHYTETQIIPDMEGMGADNQQADDGKKKKKKGGLSGLFKKPDDDG